MLSVDPTDDCTFWFTSEYVQTTGSAPWRTRIGSFKPIEDFDWSWPKKIDRVQIEDLLRLDWLTSATNVVLDRYATKDAYFKQVLDSQRSFAQTVVPYWTKILDLYSNLGNAALKSTDKTPAKKKSSPAAVVRQTGSGRTT